MCVSDFLMRGCNSCVRKRKRFVREFMALTIDLRGIEFVYF